MELEQGFKTRFPNIKKATKTVPELERELGVMRIKTEELEKTEKYRGEDIYTHMIFVEKHLLNGICMWALNLMQTQDYGWLNQTPMILVIHVLLLSISTQSIELFISCRGIEIVHLSTAQLPCIHCSICFNSFTTTNFQTINHLRFFGNNSSLLMTWT